MRLLGVLLGLVMVFSAHAQKENNTWCMGHAGGIDFNTTPPSPFTSQIHAIETTAAISDRNTGQLLFYTDGFNVWDATHTIMQNGISVGTDDVIQTTPQGTVIVPFLNDKDKYHLFVLAVVRPYSGYMFHSVIDMKLNNGLGGVVPNNKRVLVDSGFTESMLVVPGCGKVWLITQMRANSEFRAYSITDQGLQSSPVVSTLSHTERPSDMASFRLSHDNKKLVMVGSIITGGRAASTEFISINDFDLSTGKVSNNIIIDKGPQTVYYDFEFSPSNQYLYTTGVDGIYQYDITLPTGAAIKASRKTVADLANMGFTGMPNGLQLRDDGNIYVVRYEKDSLGMISNCDMAAPACTYTSNALKVGGEGTYKVPMKIVYPVPPAAGATTSSDSVLCAGATLILHTTDEDAIWQDGSKGKSYTATQKGVYWVSSLGEGCNARVDTFHVDEVDPQVSLIADTVICNGDSVLLQANAQPTGTSYQWNTGATTDNVYADKAGVYVLTISYKGCTGTDNVAVSMRPSISIDLGRDVELCKGETLLLPLLSTTEATDKYKWQDGSIERTYTVSEAGVYHLTVANVCDTVSDTLVVTERNCHFFFPSAFSPNGDGRNDIAHLVGDAAAVTNYSLHIVNRWGEAVFHTKDATKGWDGTYKGQKAEVGTYFYIIKYTYDGEEELFKGDIALIR